MPDSRRRRYRLLSRIFYVKDCYNQLAIKTFNTKLQKIKEQLIRKQQGFILIEIMVVIVIIGILATLVAPKTMGRPNEARIVSAQHKD